MILALLASAASAGAPASLTLGEHLEAVARSHRFRSLHADLRDARDAAAEAILDGDVPRPLPYPNPGQEEDDGRMRPLVFDPSLPFEPGPDSVPGELLVTFAEGVDLVTARALVGDLGFAVEGTNLFGTLRILQVRVPVGDEEQALKQLRGAPAVKAAHRNHIARIL